MTDTKILIIKLYSSKQRNCPVNVDKLSIHCVFDTNAASRL